MINASAVVALAFTVASASRADGARDVLRWVMVPVGAALAGYTALLFNQCEGRDLWQSRLLLPHTIVNAVLAGAGALSIVALLASPPAATRAGAGLGACGGRRCRRGAGRARHVRSARHASSRARRAEPVARSVRGEVLGGRHARGRRSGRPGRGVPGRGRTGLLAGGGAAALVGLWFYEDAWVRAGQSVPLS